MCVVLQSETANCWTWVAPNIDCRLPAAHYMAPDTGVTCAHHAKTRRHAADTLTRRTRVQCVCGASCGVSSGTTFNLAMFAFLSCVPPTA